MVDDTCAASCRLSGLPSGYIAGWAPISVSTTLTHATIIEIINTDLGTTKTSTIYDDEVPLPTNINNDGFRTQKVSYTRDGKAMTTDIAFPTSFQVIPQQWVWSGILSTLNDDGESTCVTTSGATFSHDYYSQPTAFTVPSRADGLDDPQGWLWQPQRLGADRPDRDATDQDALVSCAATANAPVEPAYAAAIQADYQLCKFEGGKRAHGCIIFIDVTTDINDEQSIAADDPETAAATAQCSSIWMAMLAQLREG
ncbi:uncharacterized protein HMPREF1541_03436 [Cyphellophora europaea CBS 101466]|uniref:Uncharacterized protein n=1 Tax=Cyphellophora europaea (strain CBS 101466) TaxID=1220924 RepID=W2RYU7_CYPE1|nr:uncharacterized protein HMPREF1541_03436 [Cyphellophora europaea CBS 101466]ETN41500.1 hypothetical protein HMPREF1541_03436 [Cyphellophora europaea CBS 101466]